MTDPDEFISNFIQHYRDRDYNPQERRERYLRERKLKGREKTKGSLPVNQQKLNRLKALAARIKNPQAKANFLARIAAAEKKLNGPVDPRSKLTYDGNPLKKPGSRMEEDETPQVSPTGAKIRNYDGHGLGKASYEDGSVYDAAVGWRQARNAKSRKRRND